MKQPPGGITPPLQVRFDGVDKTRRLRSFVATVLLRMPFFFDMRWSGPAAAELPLSEFRRAA